MKEGQGVAPGKAIHLVLLLKMNSITRKIPILASNTSFSHISADMYSNRRIY